MYDDIIDGNDQICLKCWWSTGTKTAADVGHIYCSLYKKDFDEKYRCYSWRHRYTRSTETPKNKKADVNQIRTPKWKFKLNV